MSDTTVVEASAEAAEAHWYDGLTASARKHAEAKAVKAASEIRKGDEFYLRAAHTIEEAYRLYLKGDKKRLEMYCASPPLNIKGSMGYEYIKAARVDKEYGAAIKAVAGDAVPSVRALATLDRFASGSDEAKAEGLEIIKAEGKAAKAEGRKPLSAEAMSQAVKGDVDPVDREATRIARIVAGNEAVYASQYAAFQLTLENDGALIAFGQAGEYFAAMGAKAGAATPLAVRTLTDNLASEIVKAEKEAARRLRMEEAEAAKHQAEAASLRPEAAKHAATVKAVAKPKPKAKRSGTAKGPQGIAELVAIAPDVK